MTNETNSSTIGVHVDPTWRSLYKAGAISALLYLILSLVVPLVQVLVTDYDFSMNGPIILSYIADHRAAWLMLQTLVLGTSFFPIVTFMAIFVSLKHINKSYAAIGSAIGISMMLLFVAYYPVLLGLIELSDLYVQADEPLKEKLATSAYALMSVNNAFNPLYESVLAVGILILSLVMLKGSYPRYVGHLGVITFVAAIIALSLWPVLNVGYLWWWVFFLLWFGAVGWRLYRMSLEIVLES